jgi:molybdopterin-containing oxidoreductase family iron-sulfur binding subunit
MNSCIGCGACVVACHAENNVPVVGKREVLRAHEMHWIRIDRYFVSDEKNPDDLKAVVFQPMLCQHCDNAPCENVCPVAATVHNSEGINQMAYNRCIGTRYCANNCPYKVRRFNWADYTGADSFPNNRDQKLIGRLDPVVEHMNDDLTRMVLNPDVTVRSRGVMEKCTFCVQRLQEAKLTAKKQDNVLEDGKAVTACMQACPTNAIVFGNVKDKESKIVKTRAENDDRLFYVIEQLHTLPNVNYLAKIRNTDEILEIEEHEEAKEGHAVEEKKEAAH